MNDAYRRLCRHLPPHAPAAADTFASDARAIRKLLEALPMANFSIAARRMLDALQVFARQRIGGVQRIEALETLRGPALQLAASTERQIVGASFPLPPQKAELGDIALEFQQLLSTGYVVALADLCAPAGTVPFLRGKQVALAAARASQHAGEHLAKAYLLYRTPTAGAWQVLHDVYAFAASLRLHERDVDDVINEVSSNVRITYVQALLVALANPYQYTQREQGDLIRFARTLAPHAHLCDGNGTSRDILIDSDADAGPGYLPEERASGGRGVFALRVAGVIAFVDEQLAAIPQDALSAPFRMRGGPTLHLDVDLARRLAAGWSTRNERSHVRLGGGHSLDTVLGLNDLHFELAGGEDFASFVRQVRGEAISLSESDPGASWRLNHAGQPACLPARVLDQGLGGYRLLWERGKGGATARARVTELVGLAMPDGQPDEPPDWMVGVIRWIRIDEHERVDAGIELLARRALPVAVRAGVAHHREWIRGVLLAPLIGDGELDYDTLLVPTEIDRASVTLELAVPADAQLAGQGPGPAARTTLVDNLRVHETTGIYRHFALATSVATDVATGAGDMVMEAVN